MKRTIATTLSAALTAATLTAASPVLPAGAVVTSVSMTPGASAMSDDARILHLLNRVTFGPTPEDIALVKRIGIKDYINEQLNPRSIEMPDDVSQLVFDSPALTNSSLSLIAQFSRPAIAARMKQEGVEDKEAIQKATREQYRSLYQQMLRAKIERDVESPRQLEEVMTDFWFNHFNVYVGKGLDRVLAGAFEQQAIRPYALGKFRDLLEATAHHPAMLFYLDNWQNTAPGSPGARGRFKGINENYARELMELHTLGVDGGYTQQDVVALAHILTGLGFPNPRQLRAGRIEPEPLGAYFDANRHDFGDKVFLGKTIRGTGEQEIEQALDMLAKSPATAHHISYQLAQYFVSDKPPASLVDRLAREYLSTGGDIKAVMSALLNSQEFFSPQAIGVKYKSPYRYAISVLRATGTQVTNVQRVNGFLRQLGEPIYGCLTPDGFKNTQDAWLNADGLLKRIAFAANVARGGLGSPAEDELQRVEAAVGSRLSRKTEAAIADAAPQNRPALLLGCPEFMTY